LLIYKGYFFSLTADSILTSFAKPSPTGRKPDTFNRLAWHPILKDDALKEALRG